MIGTRPSPHRVPAIAVASLALAAAAALGGCSSSSTNANSTSTAGAGTSPAPASTSATAGTSPSSSSAAKTTSAGGGVAGGGDFCAAAKQEQADSDKNAKALTTDSPASLEKFEKEAFAKLQGFLAIAPSAIKGDVTVIVDGDQKLIAALSAVNFDIRKVNQKSIAALETSQFTKAVDAVDAYLEKTCGINPTPSA